MRNDFESNYLAHHGILGQKWGKKNGPPYPLDSGDHSSSEKKAGWRESLEKKKEQKRLAKDIKKATKKSYTTNDAKEAISKTVRDKLTDEQKQNLIAKYEKMHKDQDIATKEYSKMFDREYSKRFKNRKPTDDELQDLYDEIGDKSIGTKKSEQAFKSWDEYVKYSRDITENLIGKYGKTKLSNIDIAVYSGIINRVLDDVGYEPIKEKVKLKKGG